jgi:hypothetical protein
MSAYTNPMFREAGGRLFRGVWGVERPSENKVLKLAHDMPGYVPILQILSRNMAPTRVLCARGTNCGCEIMRESCEGELQLHCAQTFMFQGTPVGLTEQMSAKTQRLQNEFQDVPTSNNFLLQEAANCRWQDTRPLKAYK